ncbi:MAG: response regulator [Verrucomicrobia bacterium]|nr:response regulator [Verrucomicrobiota bacterium]
MKPRVLIVDDSLTVRMDLKESFEAAGFDTITCGTVAAARAACHDGAFDLAILDVLLPDGDGLELLQLIKSTPATASRPVLLLSTEAEVRDRVRGLQTGADDYVGKPYDSVQVVARARELVQRGRTGPREHPLILIIDDSPTFAGEIRSVVAAEGHETAVAGTGEEGLRLASDLRPDIIIVDQMLPGIDGLEVIRRLRADAALRRTPCLLLTASDKPDDELRALEAGADIFAQKHTAPSVLLTKLAALLRAPRPDTAALPSLLAPKRILAVDDSATFLNELCDQLRAEGYDAVAARSGPEAIELLGSQPVDGILLDLVMPGMSGQDTCRRIKAEPAWRDIPLIILTSLDEATAMVEGINAGADDYIAKSGEFEILKARLRAQLRRRQFEDENRDVREQLHRREMEAVEMQALRDLSETRASLIADLERKNTELAQANSALVAAKEATELANRELESFSYSVSHDLRAPLRAIDGFSQLALSKAGDTLDPTVRRHLDRVREATQRMGQLIDDMLSLARVTRQEIRREQVNLSAEAHAIINQLRSAPPGDRAVEVRIGDNLVVTGDRGLLRILLENFLNNAWKFTSKVAQPVIVFDRLPEPADGAVVYYVRDNGAGFDMKYAAKLFGVFQRMHSVEEFPGTGVGLATVSRVIQRHHGRVWAESTVGQGATFFFTLGHS